MALAPLSTSIGATARRSDGAGSQPDPIVDGPLERLAARQTPLERLVADAGPLGRFRTDTDGALPAGTSAFTLRTVDAVNATAAYLGLPHDRVVPMATIPNPDILVLPAAEIPPGDAGPRAVDGASLDPRPAVAVDAGNTLSGDAPRNNDAPRA